MILTELFQRCGLTVKKGPRRDEIKVCCPFCIERGKSADDRYLLGINERRGVAHCFHCGWNAHSVSYITRNLVRVFGLGTLTTPTALESHQRSLMSGNDRSIRAVEVPKPVSIPEGFETFHDPTDEVEKAARVYLNRRGVSLLQMVRHKIGYAGAGLYAWRVLFPVIAADHKVYGWVGRSLTNAKPKYLNTPGLKMLWGACFVGTTAVVSEGIMDALRVEKALLATRGYVSVARLGSTITNAQLSQLKEFEKVIIFPDHDVPGVHGALELARQCADINIQLSVVVPDRMDGKDPGSMSEEEILDEMRGVLPWSKTTELKLQASAGRADRHYA